MPVNYKWRLKNMFQIAIVLACLILIGVAVRFLAEKKGSQVIFFHGDRETISISVEVADNPLKRALGLMFRKTLTELHGMLFIYPQETNEKFWMKNTSIPLDIIFVNSKNEVVDIIKNTTPYSLEPLGSKVPFKYAIEVNAGFTDKYQISEGSTVEIRFQ
jgi:uncharacterized membrane protein (UPF0127 family)